MPTAESARKAREKVALPEPVPGARWIVLTQGKFALVDEADYEAVNSFTWWAHNNKRDKMRTWYAIGGVGLDGAKVSMSMHRFLWQLWGESQTEEIDHKNHEGLDNRRENLRAATSLENRGNNPLYRSNTSGYKGVSWCESNGKWHAKYQKNKKTYYVAQFDDKIEAARAYDRAVLQEDVFGQYADTNFPRSDYEDK